jgi:UDP-N-acetylmuramoyl-tripeptide--D-alanyl-D-alanine ligase
MDQMISTLYRHFLQSSGISTDSRKITKGSLFFALKGENFDGNRFAIQALEKGAALAVVDDEKLKDDPRFFPVDDVLDTLRKLAVHHRTQLNIPVIAVTGTNGKTTTKELTGRVLSKKYRTFYTQGNLNNHIGVPLSVLSIGGESEIAIIEMGANHPGEIAQLCEIACPGHGLITNIGRAHLEGFGSFDGVKKAKKELYDFLEKNNGTVFVNQDDPLLMNLSANLKRITYGTGSVSGVQGKIIEKDPFLTLKMQFPDKTRTVRTHLIGDYNLTNLLAAACIGSHFGVDGEMICQALEAYKPANNRSQYLQTDRNRLILDAYNANPSSMTLAIKNFTGLSNGKKMMVLGDMLELGDESVNEHRKIIDLVLQQRIDEVFLVGPQFIKADDQKRFSHFENADEAKKYFQAHPKSGYLILIKGSRGIQLEKTTEAF